MESPAPARLAATAMLLRDGSGGVETLLVRRHAAMAFLGGAWVFPGGKLDPADREPAALARIPAAARARCEAWAASPDRPCSLEDLLGLYVAACRETFEEAGVLLARREDGSPCSAADVERLQRARDDVSRRHGAFVAMLASERLRLDGGLVPWGHWITPSQERIRFDARFFAVHVPAEQRIALDTTESTHHTWMSPAAALAAWRRTELVMAAPTAATLAEAADSIAAHGSAAGVIAAETGRRIVPVLPRLRREAGRVLALMPWDPEYEQAPGEGHAPEGGFPAPMLRLVPSRLPLPTAETRIVRPEE